MKLILGFAFVLLSYNLSADVEGVYFGSAGEGYSSSQSGEEIELSYRMFTAPMSEELCRDAGSNQELLTSMPVVTLVVGDQFSLTDLKIDALDEDGMFQKRVPIVVGVPLIEDGFLEYRPDEIEFVAVKPGAMQVEVMSYCMPTVRLYITITVLDISNLITVDGANMYVPEGWRHEAGVPANQNTTRIFDHTGIEMLKMRSMIIPRQIDRKTLRNLTNVDLSELLYWQKWGDFSGYQFDYEEAGTSYRLWWLTDQKIILFVGHEHDSTIDPGYSVIDGVVASLKNRPVAVSAER